MNAYKKFSANWHNNELFNYIYKSHSAVNQSILVNYKASVLFHKSYHIFLEKNFKTILQHMHRYKSVAPLDS